MAEETITILKIGTEEAVKNINDLRQNISKLKENLGDLEIGTQEYQDTLEELKVNQNALKDAMYATTGTFDDVVKAATGASESYNSLVHRMAALKEEFRATDDAARRADLGAQIKAVNDQLKEMDALQGNFQRNVGNYTGGITAAFDKLIAKSEVFKNSLGAVGSGLKGVKAGVDGISKSPAVATFGILVSLALKLADELKDNETAMNAVKKAMAALQPVMDFFSGVLENIAQILADLITKVVEFVTSNGLFQKIISGVMGVGNAILQYVIAPFKGIVAAIKVFQAEGVKGIGDAARAFRDEMKQGISFRQNFQAGQAVAETLIAGAASRRKEVKAAGKELGKEVKEGFVLELDDLSKELDKELDEVLSQFDKAEEEANKKARKREEERLKDIDKGAAYQKEVNSILVEDADEKAAREYEILEAANLKKLDLLEQYKNAALDRGDMEAFLSYDQELADLRIEIELNAMREEARIHKKEVEDAKKAAAEKKKVLQGVASATSSLLGAIADMYEEDAQASEKSANSIKGLRIAAATIDTISGAIAAFMSCQEQFPQPYGTIIGAIQAAAVTATGMAQIAKIRATRVSASAASASANLSAPAVASAPTLTTEVSQVRSMTSASEEDRLNRMASDQRVYILASDIEASRNQIKTQVSESSF